ncbi:MAG: dihydroorotate dehydrogenase-like protein [Anaerolineae bacterium]|nr:dihydroorotate dehydrogenase-like protein [Anaerolineae bacterium]HPD41849.1 dihydroorotate dehydrogenase-like protein [Anaerolineae bacterium]HXK42998.1 dihydroorotate dehydrogenase-like protein [Anaerolineae bacterium]
MVALTTTYLGLPLRSPIVPSASPLSRDVETLQRMADAGAGAITLHSLFEEQIEHESQLLGSVLDQTQFIYAESLDFFPMLTEFRRDEREYLKLLEAAKSAVDIPIIASLNGYSAGSWTRYARLFQEAGADAVELNIYYLPTHPRVTGAMVEDMVVEVLREVKAQVQIPVAVKLSPYFSAMAYMAKRLEEAGADGLVLFNRFYQPDLDIKALETKRTLTLSTSAELLLPLRWIAILYGQVQTSLALTTGVHTAEDVAKALMAGADVAQVCSVLLREGVSKITELLSELAILMSARGYRSVEEMKGILSHKNTPNPEAFERANYVKLIGQ